MNSTLISPTRSGVVVTGINKPAIAQLKDALARASCEAKDIGLNDYEIFDALARDRDYLDPTAITCRIVSGLQRTVGPGFALTGIIVAFIALARFVISVGSELGSYLKDVVMKYWPWMAAASIAGGAGYFFFARDEEKENDLDIGSLSTQALLGMFVGFLPQPLAFAVNNLVTELLRQTGGLGTAMLGAAASPLASGVASGTASALRTTGMVPGTRTPGILGAVTSPMGPGFGLLSYGLSKIGEKLFGKDASEITFTDNEVAALADHFGKDFDEMKTALS